MRMASMITQKTGWFVCTTEELRHCQEDAHWLVKSTVLGYHQILAMLGCHGIPVEGRVRSWEGKVKGQRYVQLLKTSFSVGQKAF